jgi:hypothetical protein
MYPTDSLDQEDGAIEDLDRAGGVIGDLDRDDGARAVARERNSKNMP